MKRRIVRGHLVLPDAVLHDGVLVIEGSRIVSAHSAEQPDGAGTAGGVEVDDWRNHWITPGFIDIHTHG
ncbi:MAG: N-acetylglucosamine-6-phosphate deacetylase, partial [Firmicutes bacterium]|nr:N-acetylglucosamine-6-phosphate deacetylase [Bacillota bacterium]